MSSLNLPPPPPGAPGVYLLLSPQQRQLLSVELWRLGAQPALQRRNGGSERWNTCPGPHSLSVAV